MTPAQAYDLVSALKDAIDLPVVLHTHCTTGMAYLTYLKGVEAGADVIDTAISPFSGGTSQPATETLCVALKELGYEVTLDEPTLYEIADYFKPVRADYLADGTLNPISLTTDTQCLNYQIPGGMLSNLLSQLEMLNSLDKFEDALKETPRVRADLGYPPLVTPTSQLVGTQAVQNVLAGERYKNVGAEIKAYCRGEYGKTPAPIDPAIREQILAGEKPIEGRYAATLPADAFQKAEEELGDRARCEEDVLSYIAFPPVAEAFFAARKEREEQSVSYSIKKVED
jgi:oxaloacetate decarboxylase alpha subunit